jgi:beta-lactamase regulating signal transducer with metallopeptidase domain
MYELLGISVMLAALALLNGCASLGIAIVWRLSAPLVESFSARTRADLLFILRITAPVLAAIAVAFFLVPSYIGYEPRVTSEVVSKKLAVLAMLSVAGVAFALWRGLRSWFATIRLTKKWFSKSEQIDLAGIDIPTFRIDHSFPIIAIVGTFRPRLFIARSVLLSLNEEELAAAIAHECGHLAARDNLKRTLLGICRNTLLLVPFGRAVDRAWAESAESAADEFAAQQSRATALNLASALVTIAKMVPSGARADVPLGAYLVGAEAQGVKGRIKRLIEISSHGIHERTDNALVRSLPMICLSGLAVLSVVTASNAKVLIGVHAIVERAVNLLC